MGTHRSRASDRMRQGSSSKPARTKAKNPPTCSHESVDALHGHVAWNRPRPPTARPIMSTPAQPPGRRRPAEHHDSLSGLEPPDGGWCIRPSWLHHGSNPGSMPGEKGGCKSSACRRRASRRRDESNRSNKEETRRVDEALGVGCLVNLHKAMHSLSPSWFLILIHSLFNKYTLVVLYIRSPHPHDTRSTPLLTFFSSR